LQEPNPKDHLLYNPILWNVLKRQIYKDIGGSLGNGGEDNVGKWGMTPDGCKVSFWSDGNILELIVVMVVKFCEYMKNYFITLSRWTVWYMNYILIEISIHYSQ
jgi:hypothetical protein